MKKTENIINLGKKWREVLPKVWGYETWSIIDLNLFFVQVSRSFSGYPYVTFNKGSLIKLEVKGEDITLTDLNGTSILLNVLEKEKEEFVRLIKSLFVVNVIN